MSCLQKNRHRNTLSSMHAVRLPIAIASADLDPSQARRSYSPLLSSMSAHTRYLVKVRLCCWYRCGWCFALKLLQGLGSTFLRSHLLRFLPRSRGRALPALLSVAILLGFVLQVTQVSWVLETDWQINRAIPCVGFFEMIASALEWPDDMATNF